MHRNPNPQDNNTKETRTLCFFVQKRVHKRIAWPIAQFTHTIDECTLMGHWMLSRITIHWPLAPKTVCLARDSGPSPNDAFRKRWFRPPRMSKVRQHGWSSPLVGNDRLFKIGYKGNQACVGHQDTQLAIELSPNTHGNGYTKFEFAFSCARESNCVSLHHGYENTTSQW